MSAAFAIEDVRPAFTAAVCDLDRLRTTLALAGDDAGALATAINLELDRLREVPDDFVDRLLRDNAISYLQMKKRLLEVRIRARLARPSSTWCSVAFR